MKVYFKEIKEEIIKELNKAKLSINIAVAWFTDRDLFEILRRKASEGIRINLLIANDSINHDSNIDYDSLNNYLGCEFHFIGNVNGLGIRSQLMHHKFCIIDDKVLVTGSYNWTIKAKFNSESISVLEEQAVIQDYKTEFYTLMKKEESKNRYVEKSKIKFNFGTLISPVNFEEEKPKPVVLAPVNIEKLYSINTINHKNLTSNVPFNELPEWFRKAKTENSRVSLDIKTEVSEGEITWHDGTWKDGEWKGGKWCNGIWKGGPWKRDSWLCCCIWKSGIWYNGQWEGGKWEGGTWKDGTWKDGWWHDGTWEGGIWKSGNWYNGTWKGGLREGGYWSRGYWKGGIWKDGTWYGGIWERGTWYGGEWKGGEWKGGEWKGGWLAGLFR